MRNGAGRAAGGENGGGGWRAIAARIRRIEAWALLAVMLVAGGVWPFVWLAGEVVEGDTHAFDRAVLLALREPDNVAVPIGPGWLNIAAGDLTALGSYAVLTVLTVIVLGLLLILGKRAAALLVFASIGGGMLLSALLKDLFDRPRPDLVPHLADVFTPSFPSGHAMLSAVTYLTLGALLARVQPLPWVRAYLMAVALVLTLLVGASRVYLGVHWPTDVLAGWFAGAAWAAMCWLAAFWLQQRGRIESADLEDERDPSA